MDPTTGWVLGTNRGQLLIDIHGWEYGDEYTVHYIPKNTLTVIIARYFTTNQHSEPSILFTEERSISSSKALTLCMVL